jgi:uncharacterized membrane protein
MKALYLFLISVVVFFAIDMVWLAWLARDFYRQNIGFLLAKQVNWTAAGIFYLLYLLGVLYFAIWPAFESARWSQALLNGALLGLLCYATYDLTNFATLQGWPLRVVVADMLWGTFLTGATAALTWWIGKKLGL